MSVVLLREAVGTLFLAGWDENVVPVAWANKSFKPIAGPWVRLTILDIDTLPLEIYGSNKRHLGAVLLNVFTVLDIGDRPALVLAEQAAGIFRATKYVTLTGNVGRILFREPNIQNIGPDGRGVADDSYYQVNVTVPFVMDFV